MRRIIHIPFIALLAGAGACADGGDPVAVSLPDPGFSLTNGPPASLVFYSRRDGNPEIYMADPSAAGPQRLTNDAGEDVWPDLSPNGQHVTFASARTGNREIMVLHLRTGALVNVSNHGGDDNWPRFSPNGREIAFHSNRDGNYEIYVVDIDGAGPPRRVTNNVALDQWPDWSPDGRHLAFRRGMDVFVIDAAGEEQNARQLTFLPLTLDQMPVWSPSGRHLAFMSFRDGYCSVFVMSAAGEAVEPAVNLTPKDAADANASWCSRAPAWSIDGRQIYFMSFRPATGGDVELFVMNADGSGVQRLTYSPGEDGGPQTR